MSDTYRAPATQRAARFALLFDELCAILRHDDPALSEDAVASEAAFHAAHRLAGGQLLASFVGGLR